MELILNQLSKSYEGTTAVHPTDLQVRSGQFTTLLGPSGCGKTTLLRMIAGLTPPDSGQLYLDEACMFDAESGVNKPVHKRKLGMVFQDFALWPHLTVFENVAFGLRAAKATNRLREKVMSAIAAVRLQGLEQRYPGQLSGGQQQRVAFARAIAVEPRLILFDEPLSALDALLREEMRAELQQLVKERGLTAIYVTHDQLEAMSMSDHIIVMQAGKVLQDGTPEEIYHRPAHPFAARFIGKSNWIEPDEVMIRPEHLRWEPTSSGDVSWNVMVRNVSYQGERYEITVELEDGSQWTAYHQDRLREGERLRLFASSRHVHVVGTNPYSHPKEEVMSWKF
ncbi:ABC transporter ATP-binding protein [Xylanibacillus composti]|uniref:Carnitine transport ATP-binding protein OpuCA n=1 Tax=Xylanibacillus composti TaxID=1572762 RepID=A0A8J4H2C6_9BACL|nr:ABC transporter ATP-binding protein [Xylanibacillus composti]GIQ69677.1 ABC transporter ATP-binding protein [Xylanibacillus composti]